MDYELEKLVTKLKAEFFAGDYPSIEQLEKELYNPDWDERRRVHDWRNYIPETVKLAWDTLEKETQIVVWFMANDMADSEEWD